MVNNGQYDFLSELTPEDQIEMLELQRKSLIKELYQHNLHIDLLEFRDNARPNSDELHPSPETETAKYALMITIGMIKLVDDKLAAAKKELKD